MRPDELTELIRVQPFSPLRIHVSDGRTYDVVHPDQIIVLRHRVDFGVQPDAETGVVERVDHVSLLHVVKVEELGSASARPTDSA